MKTKQIPSAVVFFLVFSCAAFADRELDRTEILQIFQELTSQPRKTWISAGATEANPGENRATKTTAPMEEAP